MIGKALLMAFVKYADLATAMMSAASYGPEVAARDDLPRFDAVLSPMRMRAACCRLRYIHLSPAERWRERPLHLGHMGGVKGLISLLSSSLRTAAVVVIRVFQLCLGGGHRTSLSPEF